eukprot:TRINITY_DN121831_c0_g1_i1.p1 TRINITY_DN121831_c0_g1~~TRINITY_DN121831_c0_g1_i1.p1  ORF type:complete len:430 (-),score=8.21 TRINITY_DN121831_c0_g1_i1:241-1530(-)
MREIIGGELIQQQNPEKIFAGEGADKIGPGHYEVKRELVNKYKGTNWHASNVKREFARLNKTVEDTNIGPGAYEVEKHTSIASKYTKTRPTALSYLGSRMTKGAGLPYSTDAGSENESETESDMLEVDLQREKYRTQLQVLGITIRLKQHLNTRMLLVLPCRLGQVPQDFPSPTPLIFLSVLANTATSASSTYQFTKTREQKASYERGRKQTAAFASSEKRLVHKSEIHKTPGPGQYQSKDITSSLAKKVWGKQGVFGSTERRFAQLSTLVLSCGNRYQQKTPGPGFYDAAQAIKELEQKPTIGQSAVFRSPMKLSRKKPDAAPSIGQYDQSLHTIQARLQKQKERTHGICLQLDKNQEILQLDNEFTKNQADNNQKACQETDSHCKKQKSTKGTWDQDATICHESLIKQNMTLEEMSLYPKIRDLEVK